MRNVARTAARLGTRPLRMGAWAVGLALAGALGAGGCAKARAASVPEEPLVANPSGPDALAAAAPRLEPPPRPTRRPSPAATETEAASPSAAPVTTPANEPSRELRSAPSSREAVADELRVQALIDRAEKDLGKVYFQGLTKAGQDSYRLSQRYSREATDALRERNYQRAAESAEKAAKLAGALLGGR